MTKIAPRVLHLIASESFTGASEPTLGLLVGLRALGVRADVVVDSVRSNRLLDLMRAASIEPVGADIVLSITASPQRCALDALRLRRLFVDYNVVHTHLSHDHSLALLARIGQGAPPLVRTVHAMKAFRPGKVRRAMFARTTAVIVASAEERRLLLAAQPISPARITVVPGAVDSERFCPDEASRAGMRTALGLDGCVAIGCPARFQRGRKHDAMIDALALALPRAPTLRLVLIGRGETRKDMRARAEALGVGHAVLFPGYFREDLNACLRALDALIWLVPGNDATSRAVLQGMATGLPVVGGRYGAIVEAIGDGEAGWLVEPDDTAQLAERFVDVASNLEHTRTLGRQARQRVVREYTPERRAQRVYDVYARLLKE